MERNKKWFSFVEIIIVISILILLWFVVMKISGDSKQKTINATIESQLSNLWVALNSEITEKKELSLPNGTLNYFNKEWWYSHENFSDKDSESIWVYGVLSQSNFLSEIPRDPRNNQYYAYGLLKDKQTFEVAWVIKNWADYLAKISGNYTGDKWTISLIREYNWPYFIADWEGKLPYNPEKVLLTATDKNWNSFEEKDVLEYRDWKIFKNNIEIWKIADLATEENWKKYYDLYFSEWSIARLDLKDEIKLTFWRDNDLFTFVKWNDKSKIAMFLDAGSMWIFAWSQRESESDFSVTTADTTAAVRWTVFWVNADKKQFTLVKWKIEIIKRNSNPIKLNPGERFIIDRNEKIIVNIPSDKIPYPLNKVTENKGWELAPDVVVYELPDDCYNSDCIKRTVKSESLVDSFENYSNRDGITWEWINKDKKLYYKNFIIGDIQWDLPVTKSWVKFELRNWNIVFDSSQKEKTSDNIYYSANCFRTYAYGWNIVNKIQNICKEGKYQPEAVKKNYSEVLEWLDWKVFDWNIKKFSDITKSDNYFWITSNYASGTVDKVFFLKNRELYVYYPKTNLIDKAYVPWEWLKFVTWKCFKEQYWHLTQYSKNKEEGCIESNKILDWKTWILSQEMGGGIKSDNNYETPHNEPSSTPISGICYKPWNWKGKVEKQCNIYTGDLSSKNISYIIGDENNFYWVWNNVDDIITEIYTKKGANYIANTIENNTINSGKNKNFTWVFYRGDCFMESNTNGLRIQPNCREKTSDIVADTCIIPKQPDNQSGGSKHIDCPTKEIVFGKVKKAFKNKVSLKFEDLIENEDYNRDLYFYYSLDKWHWVVTHWSLLYFENIDNGNFETIFYDTENKEVVRDKNSTLKQEVKKYIRSLWAYNIKCFVGGSTISEWFINRCK